MNEIFENMTFWPFVWEEYSDEDQWAPPIVRNEVISGLEFYAIEILFENTGMLRLDAQREPGRTNMSREPRVEGWLGSTDNVGRTAIGKYEVVGVLEQTGEGRYSVECRKLKA